MEEQNNNNQDQEVNKSNPFSNAVKKISAFLQKMNLIKPGQLLLGDAKTNRIGYQVTSKDAIDATAPTSIKGLLRKAFEDHQNNRQNKIREKNTQNKLIVHTIGQSEKSDPTQTVTQEQAKEFINPLKDAAARANAREAAKALQNQTPQNIINNTVIIAESNDRIEEIPESGDIHIDTSKIQETDNKVAATQEVQEAAQSPLVLENMAIKDNTNKIIIPTSTNAKKVTTTTKDDDRTVE